ncbi:MULTISPECIES: bifunctional biotin--[acetyl-CoA-carboxylase] ligase/biotin operon repressor BirA [unclassified Pseudomonas]|uniref:bifunctional biotin--[acetyl-CoA-carboxylase] ligase/biotin operon repressor BirA n=1 Tax=unclassified Pseudomonas TaxID=196821 RepID=UPI000BCDAAD1|nr:MULTISPECIES: bifunctional biotin--[acetyl-CoA-carboxylase] ligase/biotin operon repressor BirA [unclassified Pseudomonas]PVZ08408.1 BirA family biotin operon repressor/biotin-[acetyl-CoA-carboxylase] ligase [Pseudomonas sp. URIL14HWK12:I12]PVZ21075.1 BirA family biotin operon repressor/biotin-[acetyl-CoA-carboxylase] ligase [Pseudomonas sp. URIL14HWK12:I10]PVZ29650.1 BirA family biotin operon repressor/biotin-[acetyl-CoA-carboxylase] ligase [Pseudomonas sp. URIL14HWK12:I11]SNZ18916.1 BirA f
MLALLELMADGRFHSGEALGRTLGVSRSAVWKQLQQLEADYRIPVYKVRGKGYQLASPLSLLNAAQLQAALGERGVAVTVHANLDSTNAEALRQIAAQQQMPILILAEAQSSGRGRRGRQWVSPFGQNLYFSLGLRIEGGLRKLEALSLVAGLAVLKVVRAYGVRAGLKWPNDVLVEGKKIAGILLELVGDPADVCHVVLGIGINANMCNADAIDQAWTSLQLASGRPVDRNELAANLCAALLEYLEIHNASGFSGLRAEWEANHLWQGRQVRLTSGERQVIGVARGVDAQGGLRMEVEGVEQVFSGGELSLRLEP